MTAKTTLLIHRRRKIKAGLFYALWLSLCLLFTVFFVGPFVWMLVTSVKIPQEVVQYPPRILPEVWTANNYRIMWEEISWLPMFVNSIWITVVTVGLMLFFNSTAAFAFAKMRFPFREPIFMLIVAAMIVPLQVDLIPRFHMMVNWGLTGTYTPVILLAVAQGFQTFMLRQFFRSIPDSLFDAAKIDGMGFFQIYWRIAVPLSKPAIFTLSIFATLGVWNSYLYPLIYLGRVRQYTVQLGLALLQSRLIGQYGPMMAATVMISLPTLIVYLFFQRYFVRGIVMTGIKG